MRPISFFVIAGWLFLFGCKSPEGGAESSATSVAGSGLSDQPKPDADEDDKPPTTPDEPPALTAEDFGMSIDFRKSEQSKDAHSNHFRIVVNDDRVYYRGPWGEGTRGRYKTRATTFELTDQQRDELLGEFGELRNYELLQSVDETVEKHGGAHFKRVVEATATFVVDGERFELHLDGPTSGHPDEQINVLEHHKQARGLDSLAWQFKKWAESAE